MPSRATGSAELTTSIQKAGAEMETLSMLCTWRISTVFFTNPLHQVCAWEWLSDEMLSPLELEHWPWPSKGIDEDEGSQPGGWGLGFGQNKDFILLHIQQDSSARTEKNLEMGK